MAALFFRERLAPMSFARALSAERRVGFTCGRNSHYAIVPFGKGARARDRSRAIKARDLNQPCHQHQGREVMATKKKKAKKKTKY
jgi:hypothetical protein